LAPLTFATTAAEGAILPTCDAVVFPSGVVIVRL